MTDDAPQTLEGKMLIAHPRLRDPNFFRTVLYIVSHSLDDGALGLVLNRPLRETALTDLVKVEVAHSGRIPVFWGGPVATNKLSIARIGWQPVTRRILFEHNLTIEHATGLVMHPDAIVRAFVGYAGWAAGQLEAELKGDSWIVVNAREEFMTKPSDASLWQDILAELGPFFRLQVGEPENPGLN